MGNQNLNPDQSNTKRGGIDAIAASDFSGKRSRLGVLTNAAGIVKILAVAAITDLAIYLIDEEGVVDSVIPLTPICAEENIRIVAKGTGNAGDRLSLADPGTPADIGKVRKLPATAGLHFSPGIAEEDFVDGQLVKVRPCPDFIQVATVVALTSTNGTAAAASANLAGLAAEAEKIGDDVRAIHAALVSAKILVIA